MEGINVKVDRRRKIEVDTGSISENILTYYYKDSVVTDHRLVILSYKQTFLNRNEDTIMLEILFFGNVIRV